MARVRRKITNDKTVAIQVAGRWIQPGSSEVFELEQLPPEWRNAGVEVPDTSVKKVPAMITEGRQALEIETSSDGGVGLLIPTAIGFASLPISLAFPDFTPCIVASFVASSTASQTGNTVTVTATAHGIVGSAVKNGYRIYYPGSPSIPAGWYAGFAWVNANTVTFQRATSADVSSESINAGAAFTSVVTVGSLSLPGGSLGDKGRMSLRTSLHGDQVSAAKTIRISSGAVTFATASTTTSSSIHQTLSVTLNGFGQQIGVGARDGSGAGGQTVSSVDMSISQPIACAVNVTNPGQWVCVEYAELEIAPR